MTSTDLRRDLDRLGITQQAFASRVGVHARTVRRWLSGETAIPDWVGSWLDLYFKEETEQVA